MRKIPLLRAKQYFPQDGLILENGRVLDGEALQQVIEVIKSRLPGKLTALYADT